MSSVAILNDYAARSCQLLLLGTIALAGACGARTGLTHASDGGKTRPVDVPPPDQAPPDQAPPDGPPERCAHPTVVAQCQEGWCAIPAGCFTMGSPEDEPCRDHWPAEETRHEVTLTRAFLIGQTEVTKEAFVKLMGYDSGGGPACASSSCPANWLTWHEAAAYCSALSAQQGLTPCYRCSGSGYDTSCEQTRAYLAEEIYDCPGYRLPTEAEWEYAYRAGTQTALYNGEVKECVGADANVDAIAWYSKNSFYEKGPGSGGYKPSPVGRKQPNAWGLYDMAGNVLEWVHDRFTQDLGAAPVIDPWGAPAGDERVPRGGGCSSGPWQQRAAFRFKAKATTRYSFFGFRCARTLH